jgi:hypothetical protein
VVDECTAEFLLPQQASQKPFSLCQLIRLLGVEHPEADADWKPLPTSSYRTMNATWTVELIFETLRDFTSVSSDFYRRLGLHYREAREEWYLAREARAVFEGYREQWVA